MTKIADFEDEVTGLVRVGAAMTKLVEFEGDMIRLTPEGEKVAEDLRAGKITVDKFFDKTIQNMIDCGLIEDIGGGHFQITPKGVQIYTEVNRKRERGE